MRGLATKRSFQNHVKACVLGIFRKLKGKIECKNQIIKKKINKNKRILKLHFKA